MKIKELDKHHDSPKYRCSKCSRCWCTGCLLSQLDNEKFDIIDMKFSCSKHRYDKIEIVFLPNIYKE